MTNLTLKLKVQNCPAEFKAKALINVNMYFSPLPPKVSEFSF